MKVNVASEEADPDSVLAFYRRLAQLREEVPVLIVGDWSELLADSEEIFAYERSCGSDRAVVLANFSTEVANLDEALVEGLELSLSTHEVSQTGMQAPLEAHVFAG